MTNPKVSLVTSVFNGEKYLEETIESVLNQTYKNIEYIIIDAGSTDGTIDIIKKYEDKLSYWISEKDNGMYDGINKGFNQATGDIYAYLNADDLYSNNFIIEKIVSVFISNNVDLLFGNVEFIDENAKHLYYYKSLALPRVMIKYLRRVPFAQQTAFWKADIYKSLGGFDSSLKYVADSKFFFSILFNKDYKCQKTNETLAKFRWHSEGFSSAQTLKMNEESLSMKKELGFFGNSFIIKTFIESIIKIYNFNNLLKKRFLKNEN